MIRGFINFPVAVFFFLSGYFNKSAGSYSGAEKQKLFSRILRLLVPYFFWTAFYLCSGYLLCAVSGKPFDLLRIPKSFLLGTATAPLYFLHVLLQLTIITPLLVKIIKSSSPFLKILKRALIGITPAYFLALYIYDFSTGTQLPHYELPCFAWFIYYYLGLICSNNASNRNAQPQISTLPGAVLIALASLFIAVWEGFVIYNRCGVELFSLANSQIRFGSMLFSLAVINLIFHIKATKPKADKLLSVLGDYSFGIYAFHMFWMIPLSFLCSRIIFTPEILPVVKILQAGTCIALTFAACKFSEKIIGSKIAKTIGLK